MVAISLRLWSNETRYKMGVNVQLSRIFPAFCGVETKPILRLFA